MKVLVLYTLPPEQVPPGRSSSEFRLSEAAEEIARLLQTESIGVRGSVSELVALLEAYQPKVVFNLCEAPLGRPDLEAHVAALLEWLGLHFTGSGSDTLALCRRKDRTKAVLAAAGVPVPRPGGFPCIVKPADDDGSAGIDATSVCADADALAWARARLPGPVIVEEFLPGTEFVISLWGQTEPTHVCLGEVLFANGLQLFTYASKWDEDSSDFKNALLRYPATPDRLLHDALVSAARLTWQAVGARGYLRVDVRLDQNGLPCVLDVNPNPEMTPGMGMHRAVTEAGWTWERFVRQQVEWARRLTWQQSQWEG